MTVDVKIEASGLLDGLDGQAREDRAELVAWLLEEGFTLDEIRGAITPLTLAANRVLGDDGNYVSAREICRETGIDLDLLQRLQRAVGLPRIEDPDAAVLLRADTEAAARGKILLDLGIDEDQVIAIMRVVAEGLGHAAEAMRQGAYTAMLKPGSTELELARASEQMARAAVPMIGPMMADLLRLQLRHGFETEAVNAAERAAGTLPGARQVAVAFADLVGFTQLGEALPPEDLEHVASHLGELTREVVVAPVRFVKTIGDAVMFVSPDPVALLKAVLDLIDAAVADGLPRLRVGIAYGWAVNRAGEWYGNPVNVASRVTGVTRPGAVLAAEKARDAIGDAAGVIWSFAGVRHLRGVHDEVRLFRARRATER